MDILCIGLNHETAPLSVRERLALTQNLQATALQRLKASPGVREAFVLSTCNRVEFYLVAVNLHDATRAVDAFLAEDLNLPVKEAKPFLYRYRLADAVAHLFRVVSGMDSMVLGEPQIAGQVKEAYREALRHKAVSSIFNRLLHKSFSCSKRVRAETELGSRAVSVSSVAVELAKKIFGDLDARTVLLLGAGEMAELAARHMVGQGVAALLVASRTLENAKRLAELFRGTALPLEEIDRYLPRVDIVICSTAAPEFVLDVRRLQSCLRQRKGEPIFLIDISVPRNIDPKVNALENVYLYDMDDLQKVLQANLEERKKELKRAESIVQEEVRQFLAWLHTLDLVPTIVALKNRAEEIRREELEEALSVSRPPLTPDQRATLEAMSQALVNKLLHEPIAQIKEAEKTGEALSLAEALRRLFSLKIEGGSTS